MIIHADMDAFYASVELLDKPDLIDKPVAVGGPSKTRGVIAAANYVARTYGVRSALPCAIATRRCPDLILLKPRISHYAEYSRKIKAIFNRYTPTIEPLALDEAFLDVDASEKLFGDAVTISHHIKQDIANELGLTVSIGIAPSKFVAKIASDIDKPAGFVVVKEKEVQQFLDPLPVTRIWGVGKAFEERLNQKGIKTISQIRTLPEKTLAEWFGKHGVHIHRLACGIDPRKVVTDSEAKSISHEITFDANLETMDAVQAQLLHLTEMVTARLRHTELKGRTVSIKVRYANFRTISRAFTLPRETSSTDETWKVIKYRLLPKIENVNSGIRLLGVEVSHFASTQIIPYDASQQIDLFSSQLTDKEPNITKERESSAIDELTDTINQKFGKDSLCRGATVSKSTRQNS